MTRVRSLAFFLAITLLVAIAVAQVARDNTARDKSARFQVRARLTEPSRGKAPADAKGLASVAGRRWTKAQLAHEWTPVTSAGAVTLRSPQLATEEDISAVVVEFEGDRNGNGHSPLLLWSDEPSLTPAAFARNRRELSPTLPQRAVVLRGDSLTADVHRRIRHLFLHLPAGDIASSQITAVSVVSPNDLVKARMPAVTRITVGDDSRDAIIVGSAVDLAYDVDVPPGAELSGSVALPSGVGRARIVQTTVVGQFPLLDLPLVAQGWRNFRVPLHAGPKSTITFSMDGAGSAAYWSVPQLVVPERWRRPNVLLVVVDALRGDMLAAGGSRTRVAPFLDDLSKRSLVFSRAYAAASWTKPSLATLLTSLYPHTHRIGARFYSEGVPDTVPTLQRWMGNAGYRTAQFSANPFSGALTNLDRGFDAVVMPRGRDGSFSVTAGEVNARVVSWLEEHGRDEFFVYVHLVDTHPPFANVSGAQTPRAAYERAVQSVDGEIGRLYRELERLALVENTIVVITSDHGETFGEHGRNGHGQSVYDEEVRVPLIIHTPQRPGRVSVMTSDEPVHHADIMPTILGLSGLGGGHGLQGRDVVWNPTGYPPPSPVVAVKFAYPDDLDRPARDGVEATALVDYPWKLIALDMPAGRQFELYRLDEDPGEQQNRANQEAQRVRQLTIILDSFLRQQASARSRFVAEHLQGHADRRVTPAPALQDHLRSLGYIR